MTSITDLISNFFLPDPGNDHSLQHTANNKVTCYTNGVDFYKDVQVEIEKLRNNPNSTKRYFYMTAYEFGLLKLPNQKIGVGSVWNTRPASYNNIVDFQIPGALALPNSGSLLIDYLAALWKQPNRVDVRVMPWISPLLMTVAGSMSTEMWAKNAQSLISVRELRFRTGMDIATLNILSHPLGAMHQKMIICGVGDSTAAPGDYMVAFVSGIDPVSNRLDSTWIDAGVRVEGPAAHIVYRNFRDLWNEAQTRPNQEFHLNTGSTGGVVLDADNNPIPVDQVAVYGKKRPVPARPALTVANGTQSVQVLRTAPTMNFAEGASDLLPMGSLTQQILRWALDYKAPPLQYANNGQGLFEFNAALQKAIEHANKYIYIEDQGFTSQEIMQWIAARMQVKPNLKVIMVYGGNPYELPSYGITQAVKLLAPTLPTPPAISPPNIAFWWRGGSYVHSKVVIIDDEWCSVGSANIMRRSQYTDGELALSILDTIQSSGTPSNPQPFAKLLRRALWARHCAAGVTPENLNDIDPALKLWDANWYAGSFAYTLNTAMERCAIPFVFGDPTPTGGWSNKNRPTQPPYDEKEYNARMPDSRKLY